MEKLKAMIRRMVQEEGFSRGSRKDKEAAKSRSTVLGMIQVEEEEAPSFDMSKTSDRGDGNYVSGNLKESTIKNIIRQAIIEEAKNWPLVEVGRTAGTETSQATPPKTSAEKQAVKLYGAYIEYKMNSGNSEYGYADQRNQLALKMLKDKFKVPSNLKSKLKDKKYHDKFTDYKSIVWEGKLNEAWKPIAKKNVKYKDKWGTWNWEIESGIDTDVMGGNTPKIILHYQLIEDDGFPSSGGNTFWLKHKNGKPYTPQEAKKLVNKISNKKIHDFQRKSTNPSGTGQNIYYVDGKFIREGLSEGIDVEKWIKAIEKGEDVVVYDKKGKRYNLQGGNNKEVQVTDHWEDAGRRNVHPESTWKTLPLSKVKKIVSEGLSEAKLKRFKVFIDGEKEPLILTGKNENDVKKFAHQMIHNNKVKITKVVKEALTESLKGKFVVASIYGDLYTPTAVSEKKALKLMMKIADQYAGDNVFTLGAEYWNKPHKFNKKKIMVKEEKLSETNWGDKKSPTYKNLMKASDMIITMQQDLNKLTSLVLDDEKIRIIGKNKKMHLAFRKAMGFVFKGLNDGVKAIDNDIVEGKLSEKGIGASNYKGFWDSVDKSVGPKVKKFMPWAKGKELGAIYYLIWMVTDFQTLNAIHSKSPGKFKKWIKDQAKDGKYLKEGKLTEAIGKGMFWDDLKNGTSIEYTGGTTYVVTKIDSNKLQMSLKRRGKVGGGLFAPKAMLDKSGFESQVKTGLIKYLVNTNPRK